MKTMDITTVQIIGFMLAICMPSLVAMMGILINNSRMSDLRANMSDLRSHIDVRFNNSDALFAERLRRVEEIMDARLTRIEEHLHLN